MPRDTVQRRKLPRQSRRPCASVNSRLILSPCEKCAPSKGTARSCWDGDLHLPLTQGRASFPLAVPCSPHRAASGHAMGPFHNDEKECSLCASNLIKNLPSFPGLLQSS